MCRIAGTLRLRPVDRVRKARDQHHHRLRIRRVHLLHQLFLIQVDAFAIASFASIAGRRCRAASAAVRSLYQSCAMSGPHVGSLPTTTTATSDASRCVHRCIAQSRRPRNSPSRSAPTSFLMPCERRDGVRRRAAIPVPVNGIGERSNHRDRLHALLVERQKVVRILQQHHGFERHLQRYRLVLLGVPRLGRVFDLCVRHQFRRIQQSQPNGRCETSAEATRRSRPGVT